MESFSIAALASSMTHSVDILYPPDRPSSFLLSAVSSFLSLPSPVLRAAIGGEGGENDVLPGPFCVIK